MKRMSVYNKWLFVTLASVYFLILVGAFVRASGAGMGCPDWPKCYDQIIPPTEESQIPEGFEEILREKRVAKFQRFLKVVDAVGLNSFLKTDDFDVNKLQPFNAKKTWIEYINRLTGVAIGICIIICVWLSFKLRLTTWKYFIWSVILLIITLFEGYLGSLVVAANLLPGMITVHMFFALVMVGIIVKLYSDTSNRIIEVKHVWKYTIMLIVVFVQLLLGVMVREETDLLLKILPREAVIENLGNIFLIHRSFSWLILAGSVYLYLTHDDNKVIKKINLTVLILVLIIFLTGVLMSYVDLPFIVQPLHLLIASLLLGINFYVIYSARGTNKINDNGIS